MRSHLLAQSALLTVLLANPAAQAQTVTPAEADDVAYDGEIIVTAQKREERLRDVPLAVSAVTGATLLSQQITTATDLQQISPSLNFTPSANARGEGFAIRGVGTAIFSDTVEQSVGVVIDGVVVGRSGQATGDLLDVERIEILRGPQGMLFGKNASAGLISINTRRPQLGETTLEMRGSYATLNEIKVSELAIYRLATLQRSALRLGARRLTAQFITASWTWM